MPCFSCNNKKWRIGMGKCIYKTLAACKRALAAYYAQQEKKDKK